MVDGMKRLLCLSIAAVLLSGCGGRSELDLTRRAAEKGEVLAQPGPHRLDGIGVAAVGREADQLQAMLGVPERTSVGP